jgi:hypothetical protein
MFSTQGQQQQQMQMQLQGQHQMFQQQQQMQQVQQMQKYELVMQQQFADQAVANSLHAKWSKSAVATGGGGSSAMYTPGVGRGLVVNPELSPEERAVFTASYFVNRKADAEESAEEAARDTTGGKMDFRHALQPELGGGWSQQPHQKRAARGKNQKATRQWQQQQRHQHHRQQQRQQQQRHQQQRGPQQQQQW